MMTDFSNFDAEAAARKVVKMNGQPADPLPPITYYRGEAYRQAPKRAMVVKGLMGAGEVTFTHGPPKSGKSFLMTSCALAIAEGAASWWGHRIKRPGQVLYLVQEGCGGFPLRLKAWSEALGQPARPVPANFVWTPTRLSFVEEGSRGAAIADVRRVAELVAALEAETDQPVVLIVIDTAARVTAGADENSASDMGMFLEACAVLQDLPNRPHVNIVAHDNAAGTRMRGSSARQGGGDGFIHVERQGDTRTWCLETAKDDVETEKRGFRLQSVDLGTDEDGDPLQSCVVAEVEAPARADPKVTLTDKQANALKCLGRALADHGRNIPNVQGIPPKAPIVTSEVWLEATIRWMPSQGGKEVPRWRQKTRLAEIAESLRNKGLIRCQDDYCWLPSKTSETSEPSETLRIGGSRSTLRTSETSGGSLDPRRFRRRMEGSPPHGATGGQ